VRVADPRPRLALAPVESVSEPDGDRPAGPDPAPRLAELLAGRGRVRVVAPDALGESVPGRPEARNVRRWASERGWHALLVGRREAQGVAERVALELRSGHSGAALATIEASIPAGEAGGEALERVAGEIEAALGVAPAAPPVATPAPEAHDSAPAPSGPGAASPSAAAAGSSASPKQGGPLARNLAGSPDAPIEIHADELEVEERKGERRILFRRNVRVKQDDVVLTTDALEALYPKGDSQPERLVARGHVRVTQRDRQARCDEATYVRSASLLTCTGRAELRQRCDVVRGSEIAFDLDADRVRVLGAASVVIHPQRDQDEAGASAPGCPEGSG
jgi:lipopolysaccharide transport protein LptA